MKTIKSPSKVGRKEFQSGPPKRTRQGQGTRSLPNHGRKQLRGQGKG
jgi:hypothetical protein